MYKFLVVEDEQPVRETVVAILQELSEGNSIFSAENGMEALKMIERIKPDAIITDIMMPMKDGIELVKALHKRKEKALVAILSGYDDFEYMQAALSYGMVDYILKPVKRDELVKLYYKMLRRLKSRASLESELAEVYSRLDEIKPYIHQRCYLDLLSNRLDEVAFENTRTFLGLRMRIAPIRIIMIEIDENESGFAVGGGEDSLSMYKLTEIMENIFSEYEACDFFSISNNTVAIVWCPHGDIRDIRALTAHLELLSDELSELYKIVLNIGISEVVNSPLELEKADASARNAIHHKMLYGSGQIFSAESMGNESAEQVLQFDTSEIVENIWLNNQQQAKLLVSRFTEKIRTSQGKYRLTSIQLLCQKLLIDCLIILEKECEDLDDWYRRKGNNILTTNFHNYSVDELENFFHNLIGEVCGQIGRTRKDDRKKAVDMARQIIARNYHSDLNIEKIAKELHYSKNYFGQLFKQEMGMSVNEYINQVRVQKAKALLLDGNLKIGQIAEKVGFSDQQYFSRIFKKIVGCMPSEYIP